MMKKIISTVVLLLFITGIVAGVFVEPDLTTFSENDPTNSATVTQNTITIDNLEDGSDLEVSKTDIVDGQGDIIVEYSFNITGQTVNSEDYGNILTAIEINDHSYYRGIQVRYDNSQAGWEADTIGAPDELASGLSEDTVYYVTMDFDNSTSEVIFQLYSDSQRQNLIAEEIGSFDNTRDYNTITAVRQFADGTGGTHEASFIYSDYRIGNGTKVSGTVTDSNGNALSNVAIETNDNDTIKTDGQGEYTLVVRNQDYTFTASKDGYSTQTKNVSVDGDLAGLDFNLEIFDNQIEIDSVRYLQHSETSPYKVIIDNSTGTYDVTDSQNTTIVSNNTDVVTIDTANNMLVATSNSTINERTFITANYTNGVKEYTTSRNITVANQTMENIDIMPPESWVGTFLELGETKGGHNIGSSTQWLFFIILIMSAIAKTFENPWAGIGSGLVVGILLWVLEYVGLGILLTVVFCGIFTSLILVRVRRDNTNVSVEQ